MERAVKNDAKHTRYYLAGKCAFSDGVTVDNCPHEKGIDRQRWMNGWYDARSYSRLGHIFDKWNLKWP